MDGTAKGDLLRLLWSAYDGKFIRLRQSKSGARVTIPVGFPLKEADEIFQECRPSCFIKSFIHNCQDAKGV